MLSKLPTIAYLKGVIGARLTGDHWAFVYAALGPEYPQSMAELPPSMRIGALVVPAHQLRSRDKNNHFWVSFVFPPKERFPRKMVDMVLGAAFPGYKSDLEKDVFLMVAPDSPAWASTALGTYVSAIQTGEGIEKIE